MTCKMMHKMKSKLRMTLTKLTEKVTTLTVKNTGTYPQSESTGAAGRYRARRLHVKVGQR